jgi:hypothetical protein
MAHGKGSFLKHPREFALDNLCRPEMRPVLDNQNFLGPGREE